MISGTEIVRSGPTDAGLALRALARLPDRTAFVWDEGRASYSQTARLIGGMQFILMRRGLGAGDCVAILSSNRMEYWCAVIAVQALGASVSNLHPMGPRADHAAQLDELVPAMVIIDAVDHRARGIVYAHPVQTTAHRLEREGLSLAGQRSGRTQHLAPVSGHYPE